MDELLAMLKVSVGDLSNDRSLDDYYKNFINQARAFLLSEDIDEDVLDADNSKFATVLCAQILMRGESLADNSTLSLLPIPCPPKPKQRGMNDVNGQKVVCVSRHRKRAGPRHGRSQETSYKGQETGQQD